MFDYDARPVTPVPVLVGRTASRDAYAIRDFLSRNGYPFEWSTLVSLTRCGRSWESPKQSRRHCRCASSRTGRGWQLRRWNRSPRVSAWSRVQPGRNTTWQSSERGRPAWQPPSPRPPKACAPSWSKRWRRAARIWQTTLRPGKVLVPPLVLGMHGPDGHGDRAGHIAGYQRYAIPGDLAEDALDRDEPPHARALQPDLGSRTQLSGSTGKSAPPVKRSLIAYEH